MKVLYYSNLFNGTNSICFFIYNTVKLSKKKSTLSKYNLAKCIQVVWGHKVNRCTLNVVQWHHQ